MEHGKGSDDFFSHDIMVVKVDQEDVIFCTIKPHEKGKVEVSDIIIKTLLVLVICKFEIAQTMHYMFIGNCSTFKSYFRNSRNGL